MTYAVKEIDLTFQLGSDQSGKQLSFDGAGNNQLTLTGLRVIAKITSVLNNTVGAAGLSTVLRIYGMTLDQMNQLTVAGLLYQQINNGNLVAVQAGDAGSQKTTVFNGQIVEAYPDFSEAPQSAFVVTAITGRQIAMKPVAPVSFNGATPASTVFGQIAGNGGLSYQNNGVSAVLASPYFAGTGMAQIAAAAKAADCYAGIDGPTNTLYTIPKDGSRSGSNPTISAATGMIGYPSFESTQVVVRALFDPSVTFQGMINVDTGGQLPAADGQWRVDYLDYTLASQMPDGPWEMLIKGTSQAAIKQEPGGNVSIEDLTITNTGTGPPVPVL